MSARHEAWVALLSLQNRPPSEERAYVPIEPESGARDVVERTGDLLLAAHRGWAKLVLVLVILCIGIAVVRDPITRWVMGVTVLVMAAISVIWWLRSRAEVERL